MSKVIRKVDTREHGHIVMTEDGRFWYVDSTKAYPSLKYETMAFPCNKNGYVKNNDWKNYALVKHYASEDEMIKAHGYIITALESFVVTV